MHAIDVWEACVHESIKTQLWYQMFIIYYAVWVVIMPGGFERFWVRNSESLLCFFTHFLDGWKYEIFTMILCHFFPLKTRIHYGYKTSCTTLNFHNWYILFCFNQCYKQRVLLLFLVYALDDINLLKGLGKVLVCN